MYSHRFFAQQEEPPKGDEPGIEIRPALQQVDVLPTELPRKINELRRILLNYAEHY